MKIIAEFNSNEELASFISTFGKVGVTPIQVGIAKTEETKPKKVTTKKEDKVQAPKVDAEIVEDKKAEEEPPVEIKEAEVKVTKEDVSNACKAKMTEGKTAQVKAITSKFGAKNISSIKEEDYEAILAELEVI